VRIKVVGWYLFLNLWEHKISFFMVIIVVGDVSLKGDGRSGWARLVFVAIGVEMVG
jgi:hypothetical protein